MAAHWVVEPSLLHSSHSIMILLHGRIIILIRWLLAPSTMFAILFHLLHGRILLRRKEIVVHEFIFPSSSIVEKAHPREVLEGFYVAIVVLKHLGSPVVIVMELICQKHIVIISS